MRTCNTVDIAVPADHRVKLKENEKKDRELKKVGISLLHVTITHQITEWSEHSARVIDIWQVKLQQPL